MPIQMFVNKTDNIKVDVYVYEEENDINATTKKDEIPKGLETTVVTFTFRKPNFADSRSLIKVLQENQDTADILSIQEYAMNKMLYEWTLCDNDGTKVLINEKNINLLQPAIGRAASLGFLEKIKI